VLRIVYGGVFDRHPQAQLVIGHLGEMLPFFAGRIQRAFEYNFNDQALITTLLAVGADHIMFASDYPYDMSTDAARWIEAAPISENDRRKICYGNAAALFGLPR
jgi:predicted TIM-barrel fold metal-dependent hydrolase